MATARLYRRDGIYWVDVRQAGERRRISLGTRDRREAEARRREEEARAVLAEAGKLAPAQVAAEVPRTGPSFAEFSLAWLGRVGGRLDPHTMASYERACREAEAVIGDRLVSALRRVDARAVVEALATRRRTRATVARLVAALRACMADAVDAEVLLANPFARPGKLYDAAGLRSRRNPDEEDAEETVHFYTPEDQAKLVAFAREQRDHSLYVATLLGLRAGLRRSEMLGLQRGDLDLKGPYLQVRRRVTAGGHVGSTKSEKSRRRVPLARDLAQALREQLLRHRSDWVFAGLRGVELQDARRFGDRFVRMVEGSGVAPKRQPMHALRHTFASNLLTAGTPIFKVSKWLGHSSIEITVNRYGHLIPQAGEHEDVDRFVG